MNRADDVRSRGIALLSMGLLALAAGCSGRDPGERSKPSPDALAKLREGCGNGADSSACVAWGRQLMSVSPGDLVQARAEIETLERSGSGHPGEEMSAIIAASTVRLARFYADSGDVVKAVEMIDSGLGLFDAALVRTPSSKIVRIYLINTLSHLPKDLKLGRTALDSIQSLRRQFPLTTEEERMMELAARRIEDAE